MQSEPRQPAERNIDASAAERVRLLVRQAENVDQDAIETLPLIAAQVRELSQQAGLPAGETESLLLLARYSAMKDDYIEAVNLGSQAQQEFSQAGDALGQIKALSTLGFAYGQLGRLDTALAHFLDGLKLFNGGAFATQEHQALKANLLSNLASIYGDLGRYDEALEVLQEVEKEAEKTGGAPLVVALSNICEAYLKKGNVMNALVFNQRALVEIKTKNLGNLYLHMCHMSFGMIYERSGQPDKALASYQEALDDATRMNNRYSTANALVAIGSLELGGGRQDEARETLNKALALADEIKANELLRTVHSLLEQILAQAGDFQEAYSHLRQFIEIDRALEKSALEHRLSNYSAELRIDQARKDAEIYRLKNVELKEKTDEVERKAAELEEAIRNIQAIGEIGRRITNSLDVQLVLSTVYESVNRLMDASIFTIGFYDEAMGIVDYRIMIENARQLPLLQVSVDDGRSIASAVIHSGQEFVDCDTKALYSENAAMPGVALAGRPPRSIMSCPLLLADRIIGILTVQSYQGNAYSARNLETVKALVSYIAIALNNSRQSEELKAKAQELELASRTDPLTGLFNRRHIIEKIDDERIRHQRTARPFSVVICDIDFFKKVNDMYGHDCGDAVLKALATLLGRHIRKQDCLARWGGEEFLMLLPETTAPGGTTLAEKLRKRVEEFEFSYAGIRIPITMTFGVAGYIQDYGIDACIVGADSALYKGKEKGRNCVVTF